MKQTFTSIIALIACFFSAGSVYAQTSVFGSENEENPGGWNFELPFASVTYKHDGFSTKFKAHMQSSFSVGFIGGTNEADGVNIDMGRSIELEWNNIISAKAGLGRNNMLRIGLSLDWRNYRMTNGTMFNKDKENGQINLTEFPKGVEPKFSRIHTFSLVVPVKYYHRLAKHVIVSAGPELVLTPHATIKNRFYEDGKKVKDKNRVYQHDIHQNIFSVGLGAEIHVYSCLGVYYKYNPFNVLNTDYGPKFNSMTVGLTIGL